MSPLWIVLTLFPLLGSAGRFDCRGRILGAYYADAKSGCKAFHVCVRVAGGGIRDFRFFCPPGTLFHQEAQTCTDWGDDDPLACPADLYDGQFDLYKIGSGYDTKKLSSPGNREEESEFGLQRADTGDRRLSQNNAQSSAPVSDLRAAHSSDFFSGQRDRGRDEVASRPPQQQSAQTPPPRQSFRRPTTQRTTPSTTQYTTTQPPPPPHLLNVPQFDTASKRKLVRKRPVYPTTPAAVSPFIQNTPRQQFPEQQSQLPQQNYNDRISQSRQTPTPPANVPPQYKDEYVEVSRVTPKHTRFYNTNGSPTPFVQTTPAPKLHKKEGLVELYNYEAQSTSGFNVQKDNRPFKIRNNFNVAEIPKDDFTRINPKDNIEINSNGGNLGRGTPTTADYNGPRSFPTSTPSHRNFNSVSYEPEKNNFVPFAGAKQNYYVSTTFPSTTTSTTTSRPVAPANLNTIAYNTNVGFNLQASNFADGDEDDGQYRLPAGEDDGQYRPELYERELLSGAHSLNIAASGNRLPEDQKQNNVKQAKAQSPKPVSQSGVPRPFRPAPTPTLPPQTRAPEPVTYTTTTKPQTLNTQRTFDYYQTYTTTSRPAPIVPEQQNFVPVSNQPVHTRQTTTSIPQTRVTQSPSTQPTHPPRPTTRQPQFANPPKNKEDASYDYAYYDSDPGFNEYDHIEEFGKTKTKKA